MRVESGQQLTGEGDQAGPQLLRHLSGFPSSFSSECCSVQQYETSQTSSRGTLTSRSLFLWKVLSAARWQLLMRHCPESTGDTEQSCSVRAGSMQFIWKHLLAVHSQACSVSSLCGSLLLCSWWICSWATVTSAATSCCSTWYSSSI